MTCIIGLSEDNKVYMGGDSASAASDSWICRPTAIEKVFHQPPFLFGCATSFRMMQLLRYQLPSIPEQDYVGSDEEYLVREFINPVRELFKEHGYAKVKDNEEEGGVFLVGYRGQLYRIGFDFQVNSCRDGLRTLGCGAELALGAMKALEHFPPRERIERSLEIAAYFSGGVMPPFVIEEGI